MDIFNKIKKVAYNVPILNINNGLYFYIPQLLEYTNSGNSSYLFIVINKQSNNI